MEAGKTVDHKLFNRSAYLKTLECLRKGVFTNEEIADAAGVTPRTVYRYIKQLSNEGYEIVRDLHEPIYRITNEPKR